MLPTVRSGFFIKPTAPAVATPSMSSKQCDDRSAPAWANVSFGEIDLGERIGGGGVGIIYRGFWKNQPVALKTLFDTRISADLKKEYMDELLVMSRVKHSNIVRFLGACMTPPNLCFIMELCETSLFHILHVDRIRMSTHEMYGAAIDVASAMEYLHSLSPAIIHRDLKSHNVLKVYDKEYDVMRYKVCDFGLVKNTNTTAGTPAYMAPGQPAPPSLLPCPLLLLTLHRAAAGAQLQQVRGCLRIWCVSVGAAHR